MSSYRLVQTKFYCHMCKKEFKKLVSRDEEVFCQYCNGQFIERDLQEEQEVIQEEQPRTMFGMPIYSNLNMEPL